MPQMLLWGGGTKEKRCLWLINYLTGVAVFATLNYEGVMPSIVVY